MPFEHELMTHGLGFCGGPPPAPSISVPFMQSSQVQFMTVCVYPGTGPFGTGMDMHMPVALSHVFVVHMFPFAQSMSDVQGGIPLLELVVDVDVDVELVVDVAVVDVVEPVPPDPMLDWKKSKFCVHAMGATPTAAEMARRRIVERRTSTSEARRRRARTVARG
jgi:hypothetical protein